ncbi:MAG: response regulator transcription factor [Nitrospirota bacterium]
MDTRTAIAVVSKNIGDEAFDAVRDSVSFFDSLNQALKSSPDVLIVDETDMDGVKKEGVKVLVVGKATKEKVLACLRHRGFCGFLDPSTSQELMKRALTRLRRNEMWINREILSSVFEEFSKHIRKSNYKSDLLNALTEREREIVNSMAKGKSNKAIAETLFISESTVKNHLYNIYKKIGVNSRAEVISLLFR